VPVEEYIRYRVPPGAGERLEEAYAKASAALEAAPECLDFVMHRCVEEPDRYILRITWTSGEGHLEGFRKGPHFAGFLAEVRPFIEHIEEMQHYETTGIASRSSKDDLLGPMFANSPAAHVPHLAMWLCEVFGGPPLSTDTLGDIGRMLKRHANLDLGEAQRTRFRDLAAAAARLHIADDAAVAAVGAYFDWGTAVAVENSKPGHVPDAGAGVPRWGWGVSGDA